MRSAGGQVQWSIRSWALEVEFVAGTVRPSEGPHVSRRGHTSMVSYTLTDRWTPYLRLETLDPNISDTTRQCRDASPVIRAASGRSFSTWRSRWRTLRSRRSPLGTPTRCGDCACWSSTTTRSTALCCSNSSRVGACAPMPWRAGNRAWSRFGAQRLPKRRSTCASSTTTCPEWTGSHSRSRSWRIPPSTGQAGRTGRIRDLLVEVMAHTDEQEPAESRMQRGLVTRHSLVEADRAAQTAASEPQLAGDDRGPNQPCRGRALVAEDNHVNQIVAVAMLKKLGWEADVAINGVEAVSMFEQAPYDVILMDCQMPELDGFGATRRIRELQSPDRIPIIAMTANAMDSDRDECLAAGMDDFVTKPVSIDRLSAVLQRWAPGTEVERAG